ncbi:hypothetical protein TorRG33x02_313530 [Trema orientale]|uniref:Uncharacterized protein n=1 Tax=Trema orientale TaxID=63057 RepID=A0A2P5BPQ8_TREOI|nr:hypothetical protein TorRG33x02_313530 [Trema orientale]
MREQSKVGVAMEYSRVENYTSTGLFWEGGDGGKLSSRESLHRRYPQLGRIVSPISNPRHPARPDPPQLFKALLTFLPYFDFGFSWTCSIPRKTSPCFTENPAHAHYWAPFMKALLTLLPVPVDLGKMSVVPGVAAVELSWAPASYVAAFVPESKVSSGFPVLHGLLIGNNQKGGISIPTGIIQQVLTISGLDSSWSRDPILASMAIVEVVSLCSAASWMTTSSGKGYFLVVLEGLTAADVFAVEWIQTGVIHFGMKVSCYGLCQ